MRGFLVDGATAILIARECRHSSPFPLDPQGVSFVLLPDGELAIDLRGDLAGIVAVAAGAVSGNGVQKRRKPPLWAALSVDLVRRV